MYFGTDYHPEHWVYPFAGTPDDPEALWRRDLELMVSAGVNVVRRDVPRREELSDVLLASINAALEHRDEAISYALGFARDLGRDNIRVNCVIPGWIITERQKALWLTPEKEQAFLDAQCLKFRLSEDDIARTALFLASDEARGITGQNLIVDAGLAQTSG